MLRIFCGRSTIQAFIKILINLLRHFSNNKYLQMESRWVIFMEHDAFSNIDINKLFIFKFHRSLFKFVIRNAFFKMFLEFSLKEIVIHD